jgi:beta-N-acetylhexosaminidase
MRRRATLVVLAVAVVVSVSFLAASAAGPQAPLDRAAERWVHDTLKRMTPDEKVGQLLAPAINAVYTPADSDVEEQKLHLVRDLHVGGMHVFGGAEPMPQALLNANYGTGGGASRKGDPYAAALFLNRLQQAAKIPLLTTADFEGGANYILNGATRFPRGMVIGATRDPRLAFTAGRMAAQEGRSIGVMVDFYPVLDVNNNPRNPIINLRSFGEDPAFVAEMGRQFIKGIQAGGMLSTAKHFPGHGDTAVDTHIGLAVIQHSREHLERVELPPFRMAVEAGIDAFMSTHIVLPALDPAPGIPATLSRPILTGLLRGEMGFQGIVYTDSMSMHAISKNFGNGQAAAMAVKAGVDQVLDIPEPDVAFAAIKAAVQSGEISEAQVEASVERLLRVKARLGLHKVRTVDVAAIASAFGGRANARAAQEICERGLTLLKDERTQVPLKVAKDADLLYLSVIDYASGWREGAPSRTFIPELKKRWPNATAIEISDRTTASEMELVRELGKRADAVVASVFVRISSYSGRMDLSPAQVSLLESLASDPGKPFAAVLFGNPYTAMALQKLPALLVTYEQFDAMEAAAVRALAGEIPIRGKLPITMPGLFAAGTGLER